MDIKDLESGMIIAEAITSLDVDVVLLVSESILDKKKLDKIKKYSSKYNIKNPIKVYKNS
ncbi:MAG: hypothetical protein N4A48_14805 [Tepidibacter sp.]|uniref:hypothetical protein n=1 Tax=Tepidibacter sp. TaxID=2529387 RepID=UPI0025EE1B87|nr:hypothetical protein [Tepidibacter sp.]MCT4509999.1 hypothetical protein [Tepidibacter sp.]